MNTVPISEVGALPNLPTYRATDTPPGSTPLESGDATCGQSVYVRAFGSWRPGVIHFAWNHAAPRTRVPVAFRVPSTPAGKYTLRNMDRQDIRIPELEL